MAVLDTLCREETTAEASLQTLMQKEDICDSSQHHRRGFSGVFFPHLITHAAGTTLGMGM